MATLTRAFDTTEPRRSASQGLSYWRRAARHLRGDQVSVFAAALLAGVALVSLAAPLAGRCWPGPHPRTVELAGNSAPGASGCPVRQPTRLYRRSARARLWQPAADGA